MGYLERKYFKYFIFILRHKFIKSLHILIHNNRITLAPTTSTVIKSFEITREENISIVILLTYTVYYISGFIINAMKY